MMTALTSEAVKEFGYAAGLDGVGIANIERLKDAPEQMQVANIFPECKSVIVTMRRIPRGVYRGIEEGTHWSNYTFYGYNRLNSFFRPLGTYRLACFIEDRGWEAVPVYPGVPESQPTRDPVRAGQVGAEVYPAIRIAAIAAGLGECGWSKVFLTKRFGPRQRLGMILTDAELEPDPLVEPNSICNLCMDCVRECHGHAIPHIREGKTVSIQIEDKTYSWADVDMGKCTLTHHGLNKEASPFLTMDCPGLRLDVAAQETSEEEAYKLSYTIAGGTWRKTAEFPAGNVVDYYKTMLSTTGYYAVCGASGCIRACMMNLEKTGRIESTFEQPFRKRPRWRIDHTGKTWEEAAE
jgi:epoxyqueuosine reductase